MSKTRPDSPMFGTARSPVPARVRPPSTSPFNSVRMPTRALMRWLVAPSPAPQPAVRDEFSLRVNPTLTTKAPQLEEH